MTSAVYIYAAPGQPATRYVDRTFDKLYWTTCKRRKLLYCHECDKRRIAANLRVQVYYDHTRVFCAPGKGCALLKPKRRKGRKHHAS